MFFYQYAEGDGNDLIYSFNQNSTLNVTSGNITGVSLNGFSLVFNIGNGSITLSNYGNNPVNVLDSSGNLTQTERFDVVVNGTEGDDSLTNFNPQTTINALGGNDTISNAGSNVKIYGGSGNDSISNSGINSNDVTIEAGAGDDTISNSGINSSIIGDEGNDYIQNSGSNVTINGGNGNDTILHSSFYNSYYNRISGGNPVIFGGTGDDMINIGTSYDGSYRATVFGGTGNDIITLSGNGSSNSIIYNAGDGNDTVLNFTANDTLQIVNSSYSTTAGGNDIIVSVGDGSILLKDAASISPNIEGTIGEDNSISDGGNNTTPASDSRDIFVYANGEGDRTIRDFKAGSSDNSDVIYLQGSLGEINREGNVVTVNGASGGALVIETDFSTDEAILYTIDGENIGAAKLADSTNTLYYDKNVYYFRFNDNAGRLYYWGGEDVTIALDNSTTPQEYIGLKSIITRSDTEKASGNLTLIGNDLDNEIYSGAGNDYLTGGSGADTFYWGSGDGYDIITDANTDDTINLYNVSLSDISSISVSDNKLDLRLNDGSHLDAYYGTQATFQFSDGARYKYENNDWQQQD